MTLEGARGALIFGQTALMQSLTKAEKDQIEEFAHTPLAGRAKVHVDFTQNHDFTYAMTIRPVWIARLISTYYEHDVAGMSLAAYLDLTVRGAVGLNP